MYQKLQKKRYTSDNNSVDVTLKHIPSMTNKPRDKELRYDESALCRQMILQASGSYNYKEKALWLKFWNEQNVDWRLVSISGLYLFSRKSIDKSCFIEVPKKTTNHPAQTGLKTFKLDIKPIYRHILMPEFTVDIKFMLLGDVDKSLHQSKYSFEIPYFNSETEVNFKYLGHYPPKKSINALFNYKFRPCEALTPEDTDLLLNIHEFIFKKATTKLNILKIHEYALNIEDLTNQCAYKTYALKDVVLKSEPDERIYSFNINQNQLPFNFKEMALCLVTMDKFIGDDKINEKSDCVFVKIREHRNKKLFFELIWNKKTNYTPELSCKQKYYIRFIPNRIAFRSCLQALEAIGTFDLNEFFEEFEIAPPKSERYNGEKIEKFEFFNKQVTKNIEQMTAIKNIVNCTAYPFPYCVFGPPGTGKTSCIVECIAQILKLKPNVRIMVTSQSNSACDEIGVRLLKYVSWNKVFRYYSPSMQMNSEGYEIPDILRRTSNLRNGNNNQFPTKEEYSHFRVIIATLMSCSRLTQINDKSVNRHFDYIIVDECGAAMEPESLVPIVGFGTAAKAITSNVVLLGDYKQLGPLISSPIAKLLGLNISLLERIMSKRRYRDFDKNYVIQLLDNYRSHPGILQFSNVLFYDSKLRARIAEPDKSYGLGWKYLSNKKLPILFHCNKTPNATDPSGNSYFNNGEIEMVRFYVELLLRHGINGVKVTADDIGIVSPYKAQLNMLKNALGHIRSVEIGTAEYYQGREKKIIIISTVKSQASVGFLSSEKRLNVCITRAKSLLILVGNADTLQQNDLWNSFLHFCKANDACCGEPFTLQKLTDEERKTLEQLNSVLVEERAEVDLQQDTKDQKIQAIKDRLDKLKLLMSRE